VCTSVVAKSYPMVAQAIDIINNYSKARMTGTGASVFAGFDSKARAEEVLQQIRLNPVAQSWISFVARGLNQSPLHGFLKTQVSE